MPAITISIRSGSTGAVRTATSAADVVTAIQDGDDILFNGQTASVINMGGQWLIQGQPVQTWFTTAQVIPPVVPGPVTGPTVAPVDQPAAPPVILPPPVIRTDPFPVTAAGSLDLTPGTLILLAAAAYFLWRRS